MADIPQWWMRCDWFDVCSCNIACPCEFAQAPTNNRCEGVLAYHVHEGAYGDVRLDGLNVIGVAHFEGNIWAGEAKVLMGLFIEVRGLEFVPITFEVADDLAYWRAEIPGKVTASAEALSGPTTPPGTRVQLHNPPGSEVGPGQVATWGKTTNNRVDAYGFRWDWAGKFSKHIPFDWTGPA